MASPLILVLSGAICLGLCLMLLYVALPRAGRPESALVATEMRAMSIGMLLMVLFCGGLMLLAKGLL
jgi:hypothetical protein